MEPTKNEKRLNLRFWGLLAAIAVAAASRLIVYAVPQDAPLRAFLWNFTPIFGIALFGASHFARRWSAFVIPLAAMAVSDVILHVSGLARLYTPEQFMNQTITYVFAVIAVFLGLGLRGSRSAPAIAGATIFNSVAFFLGSNFVYWLTPDPAFSYPHTLEGLFQCYFVALPFFRNGLMGDLFYVTVLFGGWALAERRLPALRQPQLAPAVA
jgi:hypothetical protein